LIDDKFMQGILQNDLNVKMCLHAIDYSGTFLQYLFISTPPKTDRFCCQQI